MIGPGGGIKPRLGTPTSTPITSTARCGSPANPQLRLGRWALRVAADCRLAYHTLRTVVVRSVHADRGGLRTHLLERAVGDTASATAGKRNEISFPNAERLTQILAAHDVPFSYEVARGIHDWNYWDSVLKPSLVRVEEFFNRMRCFTFRDLSEAQPRSASCSAASLHSA